MSDPPDNPTDDPSENDEDGIETYGDRYVITREIGSGGMAEVYLAQDRLLGRSVALKVLHPEYARDRAFIERFRREAQAAARLNDSRVVSIFDWGSDDGTYYIVMEYVEGRTLREILEAERRVLPERAVEIIADVCDALELAHEQGIVHRDIKPANIIINKNGVTKVTDFGIARAATDSGQTVTQTGTVIGTAAYLSPEQAQGLPVDPRSDVYSAAIVLFELITGDVPFQGDTPVSIAYKHVTEEPPPPSSLNPDVSEDLDAVVMKGLAKNPENRYQSAEEMAEDLRRISAGEPVAATPLLAGRRSYRDERTAVVGGVPVSDRTQVMAPAEPRGSRGLVYALIGLLIIGILLAIGAFLLSQLQGPETAVVPEVVGKTYDDAEEALVNAGFRVDRTDRSDPEVAGLVIEQRPDGQTKAEKNSIVTLVVSKGPELVKVPDIRGKSEDDAEKLLTELGLELGSRTPQNSDEVQEGLIIDQDPKPEAEVEPGTEVAITVSSGKPLVQVPELRNLSEEAARDRLQQLGLQANVTMRCDTGQNDNRVLDQNPQPGTEVDEGATVELVVNDTRSVPNVITKSEEAAREDLSQAGFDVRVDFQDDEPGDQDRVVDQEPSAGASLCEGNTVRIVVEQ